MNQGGFALETFRPGTRRQLARILNHPGHLSHPNSENDFDTHRDDNVSRAFAVWSLQHDREDPVEYEAMRRSLSDGMAMFHFDDMLSMLNISVFPLDGFWSADYPNAQSALHLISNIYNDVGQLVAYHPFLEAMRMKPFTIMVTSIDGAWVAIGIHISHQANNRPDPANLNQIFDAEHVRVWDVSGYHRAQRAALVRDRLVHFLAAARIRVTVGVNFEYVDQIPNVEKYESGLFCHEIVARLYESIDSWMAIQRGHAGPVHDLPWRLNDSGVDILRIDNFFGGGCTVDRCRSRMLGYILMGASLSNQWQSISAIELPGSSEGVNDYQPYNMQGGAIPPGIHNNWVFDEGSAGHSHRAM